MADYLYTKEEVLSATNGGLDVILHYYPQASECVNNGRKFKMRQEKTPSATLKRLADGNYVITDFGGDGKPRNAIAVVMDEERLEFGKAILFIAKLFNMASAQTAAVELKPEIRQRPATPDEEDGTWSFEHEDYTERDLRVIFSENVINYVKERAEKEVQKGDDWQTRLTKICKKYYMYKLKAYHIVKDRKVTSILSTEHYPIFCFEIPYDGKVIRKIYQPLSEDKSRRFIYEPGKQPKDYIFGLNQAQRAYEDLNNEDEPSDDDDDDSATGRDQKLPEIIWCTGGSDGLNVAALDYQVIWLNSETANLNGHQYHQIQKICSRFCILPDIDATGVSAAHKTCMIYLDLRTIVLPHELAKHKDRRGNPCKDVRDYFRYYKPKDFETLVKAALPYKFWDEVPQFDKKGRFTGYNYDCNNTHLYWFLSQNGFYQFTAKNEVDTYIQIEGNIVSEVDHKKIRKFITNFLAQRGFDTKLRNTFYRTTQLNATSFENLPHVNIDFTSFDQETQWLFFANRTWKVTKSGIEEFKPDHVKKYVWQKEVINHNVKLLNDFFTIHQDDAGEWHLKITDNRCLFFQFLQKISKMHWRVEEFGVPDGNGGMRKTYTEEEEREHELHILNKIYALGYLLHRYKEPSSAFAVWAMENEVIEDSQSEGRSGKSIYLKFPRYFGKTEIIASRKSDITSNKHLLENVNEFTNYVLFDDCGQYFDFPFFFPLITGPWNINPKNTRSFTLDESDSPKTAFSSNFPPNHNDSSTLDRLIFAVFSDYYHSGPNERHAERRSPKDDFGINLFNDFNEEQWNLCLNFGAQCIKAYLNILSKLNPPMDKVSKRQLLAIMGDTFKNWADVYFSIENNRLDAYVVREEAFHDYINKNNVKGWSAQKFGKAMRAWAQFYNYRLNPKELTNDKGRIVQSVNNTTKEMIYVATKAPESDLPF